MKIIGLAIIILSAYFYFTPENPQETKVDAVEVKASAPKRTMADNRGSQVEVQEFESEEHEVVQNVPAEVIEEEEVIIETSAKLIPGAEDLNHVAEQVKDQEEEWENQLKESLINLEPEYGQEMYSSYQKEKENYQAELDAVLRSSQKDPNLETLIEEIEAKHDDRVKEILGTHYEELKDQQNSFLEAYRASGQ